MPNPQPTYNDRLAEARMEALGEPADPSGPKQETLAGMYRAYAQMLVDVQTDVADEVITEERAGALRQAIGRRLQDLQDRLHEAVRTGQRGVIDTAIAAHQDATEAAAEAAGRLATLDIGEQWADVPQQVLRETLRRRDIAGASTLRTIIRRNLQSVADDIDQAIVSAIGRGVSQQRLTRDLAEQMARQDEALRGVLTQMGRIGERTASGSGTQVLDKGDLSRARRLLYDARRIAVSEINTAYDEADKISAARSPVVDLVRWKTSSRHDSLDSSPDVCDVYERQDVHGYGSGLYHPETVPSLPHPHCQCSIFTVLKDPADYGTPGRPRPDAPDVDRDAVREIMEQVEGERSVTDAHVESQLRMLRQGFRAIYDAPRS